MLKFSRGDKILVLILLIISISLYAFIAIRSGTNKKLYISIQVNGKEIKKISLAGSEKKKYLIETEFGKNIIEYDEDSVRVIEASCPDKLDVLQGAIRKSGEVIVCLPNRLIVELIGGEVDDDVDIINY